MGSCRIACHNCQIMPTNQTTHSIIMVNPAQFGCNAQTAATNVFQRASDADAQHLRERAKREFADFVTTLRKADVEVIVFDDTDRPVKPDAVFPNNWLTTHVDGTSVLYPMQAANRRKECRPALLAQLATDYGYTTTNELDLTDHADHQRYLEGTGSLVLDRATRTTYACLSPRTNLELLAHWCERMQYNAITFSATCRDAPIYHTNVMMAVGTTLAVVCLSAITDHTERARVRGHLEASGHRVLAITEAQMNAFAGNMLELADAAGAPLMVMSQAAQASLTRAQLATIAAHARIVTAAIPTIEANGGGSVRCMIAENFLPLHAP